MRTLVTGGTGGIGAAVVRKLAALNHDVDFTYSASTDAAQLLVQDLKAENITVCALRHDLSTHEGSQAFCQKLEVDGNYDIFIHALGASQDQLAGLVNIEKAEDLMRLNFLSLPAIVGTILRFMFRRRWGRIIAVSSISSHRAPRGSSIYAATKAAENAYIRTLSLETAARGITANCVCPGFVDTPLLAPYAKLRGELEKKIPMQRYGQPEEIAELISFLISPAAAYITGTEIIIDGGLSAAPGSV